MTHRTHTRTNTRTHIHTHTHTHTHTHATLYRNAVIESHKHGRDRLTHTHARAPIQTHTHVPDQMEFSPRQGHDSEVTSSRAVRSLVPKSDDSCAEGLVFLPYFVSLA